MPTWESKPASRAVAVSSTTSSVHVVNHGDTLLSISRQHHVPLAELARANNLDTSAKLKLGMKLNVPGAKTAAVVPAAAPVAVAAAQPAAALAPPPVTRVAALGPAQGDFNRDLPTKAEYEALDELIRYLRRRVGKVDGRYSIVRGHKEINPRPTDCPGNRFPLNWLHRSFPD